MKEWLKFSLLASVFLVLYFVNIDVGVVAASVSSGFTLLQEYARLHVLTCLLPAFFIAGTIAVFVKKDAVLQLLGPTTRKAISYPVAAVSGGILAVCSCTILPLFTGIYKRGAGIGPAVAFLFTGPAINITAILLTGSVIGWDFAAARLIAALIISLLAGLAMASVFREHDEGNKEDGFTPGVGSDLPYSNWLVALFFVLQLAVLIVFGLTLESSIKMGLIVLFVGGILATVVFKFQRDHSLEWLRETWGLGKKILPYLFVGVFLAGILEVVVPESYVTQLVGQNTIVANLASSVFGAFMYFATLTEVPVIQKLMGMGMERGPALTLFLTGNSLSLPSMIVLYKVMGVKQASAYILFIVVLSAVAGLLFGEFF